MRSAVGIALFVPGVVLWTLGFMVIQEYQWTLGIALCLVGGFMAGAGGWLFMVKRPR